jgi:hypothetical protein
MLSALKYLGVALVVAINLAVAGYVSLFAWLMCNWMTGHQARDWVPYDWLRAAFGRFLYSVVIALVVGGVCGVINRLILQHLLPTRKGLPWILAATDCMVIAFSGLVGSVFFYVEKPWM